MELFFCILESRLYQRHEKLMHVNIRNRKVREVKIKKLRIIEVKDLNLVLESDGKLNDFISPTLLITFYECSPCDSIRENSGQRLIKTRFYKVALTRGIFRD